MRLPRPLVFVPLAAVFLLTVALRCAGPATAEAEPDAASELASGGEADYTAGAAAMIANPDTALFAGGCFWCMETAFEGREGVLAAVSGFAGGALANPTYDQVSRGGTGHAEVVLVVYDPARVSYETLLHVFWRSVDPFSAGGQFCDRGDPYRAAIFALDAEQRRLADASFAEVQARFSEPVVTEVHDAAPFYVAEEYHQDFYRKDPERYHTYREGCGRDARLREVWGDEAGRDPEGHPDAVH